ncbi:fibronectin type III domain-containing protein [Microbacterium sp. Mcb102]|uniref:fibronectin type III domain-containing protein n=1 Tax=Microbacterium sp. Mcb102 TaxID=2926012 RepID=UPI0021C5DD7C|nr:fibronectin type III domain-containing protein [Microbacterium sp. Mcb102]
MASDFGDLNGSGNQQIYVAVSYVGPNQAGNYSTYRGEVRYYGNGWGSWDSSSTFYWSAAFGGRQFSGTWNIPHARRNDTYTVLWTGTFTIAHSAEGYGPSFGIFASIDTNHTSIGDGTASATEGAAPRIPKPPTLVRNVRATKVDPTALTIAWDAPADNRGAAVIDYRVRINVRSPADSAPYTDVVLGAGARSHTFKNLRPATPYYVVVYARNSAGNSPKSTQLNTRTNSGAYLWTGSKWEGVETLPFELAGFGPGEVLTYTSSGWKQAL